MLCLYFSSQTVEDEILPTAAYAIISNPGIRATTVAKCPDNGAATSPPGARASQQMFVVEWPLRRATGSGLQRLFMSS
jgi:hypothetical protein